LPAALMAKLWVSAAVAAGAAWAVKIGIGHRKPIVAAVVILGTYGVVYFAITYLLRVEECAVAFRRLAKLRR
jgi:putative peptidoglycan lipid II flippase